MSTSSSNSTESSFSTSFSSNSSTISPPHSSSNTSAGQTSTHTTITTSMGHPVEGSPEGNLAQLLGSPLLLGGVAGPRGPGSGPAPSITVTLPGVPHFLHGISDFTPVSSYSATENQNMVACRFSPDSKWVPIFGRSPVLRARKSYTDCLIDHSYFLL